MLRGGHGQLQKEMYLNMDSKMHGRFFLPSILALTVGAVLLGGCSGVTTSSNPGSNSSTPTGSSFVVGTDAPMASVTSFSVQLTGMNAYTSADCSGTGVSLISPQTVDFARFNGLQTLIDMNNVAAGTYNCVSIALGTATLGYLDTTTAEPKITTEAATLSSTSLTFPLAKPMVVATAGAPVGLHMDFNLRKSIEVDSGGNITGAVTPTFTVKAVNNSDPGAYIDEFIAAVVSTSSTAQTFTIQGPHGRQFTVNVTGQTEWDGGASLSTLNSSSIVQVSGTLDRADATIDADEVALLSDTGFYAAGQVTYVNPTTGPATSFDLYVRGTLAHEYRRQPRQHRYSGSQRHGEVLYLLEAWTARAVPLQSKWAARGPARGCRRTRIGRRKRFSRHREPRHAARLGLQRNCSSRQRQHQ